MINFERLVETAYALKPTRSCGHFHITFILKGKHIWSIGINNIRKTNPVNIKYKYLSRDGKDISQYVGTHSECRAINKLPYQLLSDLKKCKLVNIRINNNSILANSKPCEGCHNRIKELNFKEVWYSTGVSRSFECLPN